MKGEKNPLQITHISWEDFKKLKLKGYEHRQHHYRRSEKGDEPISNNETGEFITDSRGGRHWVAYQDVFSKVEWDEVSLNKIVEENIEFSKKEGWTNPICLAIHNDRDEKLMDDMFADDPSMVLYRRAYLDKYMTRLGMQTYLIRCDVAHLYSKRNYFYTKDDYFEVDKRETKAVYLIHWN